jgi:hypothetical protein
MNKRIKELATQATAYIDPSANDGICWDFDKEKFARLIMQECISINQQELSFAAFEKLMNKYQDHFGVEL